MSESTAKTFEAVRDQLKALSVDANSTSGELALLIAIILVELEAQFGFNSAVVDKHLMDRAADLSRDPSRQQARRTILAIEGARRVLTESEGQ